MDGKQYNSELLELFARTPGAAAEAAMFQVLRDSGGWLQRDVLRLLVGRGDKSIAAKISRMMPVLDVPAFNCLRSEISVLEPVARAGLSDSDENIRLKLIKLLARCGRAAVAYLLSGALGDDAPMVRKYAANGLADLIRQCKPHPAELLRHILPAVQGPLRNIAASRNVELLQLVVLLGSDCPPDALESLDKPASKMGGILSDALRHFDPIEAADFIVYAQKYKNIARICRSYIMQADWPTLAALGRRSYWKLIKPVAASLKEIKHIKSVSAQPTGLGDLPSADQPNALRMVMACGISPNTRRTVLATALGADKPAALAAMEPGMFGHESCADLVLLALHGDYSEVQSVAVGRVISQGIGSHFTKHLLGSVSTLVEPGRTAMNQFLAAQSFEKYWRTYVSLDEDVRSSAGRALLKLDDCVGDMLTGRLLGRDINGQFRAIEMIRRMDVVDGFADKLARLASHGDHTVRSAAVAALSQARDYDARDTLGRRLDDSDPRVQANAIEALENLSAPAEMVLDKLDSVDCRVRANAVKWLTAANHPQGAMSLASMLTDERPDHRISALWVVKNLKYVHAWPIVNRLCHGDEDVRIRARANGVLQLLRPDKAPHPEVTA